MDIDGETGMSQTEQSIRVRYLPSTWVQPRVKLQVAPSVTRLGEPLTAPYERGIHGVVEDIALVSLRIGKVFT